MTGLGEWLTPSAADGVGVVAVVLFVGLLLFRGALVPGPQHRAALQSANDAAAKAEARADRWEAVALRALTATERLTEPVETAAKVLTKIPSPPIEGAES